MRIRITIALTFLFMSTAIEAQGPLYKPSSRSPEPVDISINAYGASTIAPEALGIAEIASDFTLPVSGGGEYQLSEVARQGPVVLIFYRGHW